MAVALEPLSLSDGRPVWEMLQEIGPGENGFQNDGYAVTLDEFSAFLQRNVLMSQGVGVESHLVPRTVYWLVVDGRPVGLGKLRHALTDYLRPYGHIGFCIRPSERGKGYGTVLLRELLVRASELGLDEVELTCGADNVGSRRVIEACGGVLCEACGSKCRYAITTPGPAHGATTVASPPSAVD